MDFDQTWYIFSPDENLEPCWFSRSKSQGQIFTAQHPCEHSRINILQWILTKLDTYLVLRRVLNPIDFQGHRKPVVLDVNFNKGNAKRAVSPRLKIRPCDLDLWPWKSIGFQILLRSKYVPSLVKIHWRMLILVFTRMLRSENLTRWHWPLTYDLENQ
jgi:hypothetical protein